MKILINHLTRMKPGYVCVAGLTDDGRHIRPVFGRLPRSIVSVEGGPFDIGTIVNIGAAGAAGTAPELEDHSFDPTKAKATRSVTGDELWSQLNSVAHDSLQAVFGAELVSRKSGATVDRGQGHVSLGVLRPAGRLTLSRSPFDGKARLGIQDPMGYLDLSTTDLRLVDASHQRINEVAFADVENRLKKREPVLLSVGLARAFLAKNDTAERHWLQVNNFHFENNAEWRLDSI